MKYENITEQIIGAAFQVYNTPGFGFLESVYEKSLCLELDKIGLNVKRQEPIKVFYTGEVVGEFYSDLIIENRIIIELKSVRKLHKKHEVQPVNYLTATGTKVGLLINFGENRIQVKRKVKSL